MYARQFNRDTSLSGPLLLTVTAGRPRACSIVLEENDDFHRILHEEVSKAQASDAARVL